MSAPASTLSISAPAWQRAAMPLAGLAVIVAATIGAAFAIWRGHEDARDDWRLYLANLSAVMADHADQTVAAANGVLSRVIEYSDAADIDNEAEWRRHMQSEEVFRLITRPNEELPQIDVVSIIGRDGRLLNFSRSFPAPTIDLTDRDYFVDRIGAPGPGTFLSQPVQNRGTGTWIFYLARTLASRSGQVFGVAIVGMESAYFQRFYGTVNLDPLQVSISLFRRDGILLARHPERDDRIGVSFADSVLFKALAAGSPTTIDTDLPRRIDPHDHRSRMLAPRASSTYPLVVNIAATDDLILRHWRRSAAWIGFGTLGMNLLVAALAFGVHRLLMRRHQVLLLLDRARAEAEQASRAKSAFLATMSHELRTPMNGVLGMTELLMRSPLDAGHAELARKAHRSGLVLLDVINDVLDISKIEAGRIELEAIAFRLAPLADAVLDVVRDTARQKHLHLQLQMAPGLPAALIGDPLRLRQVLSNLLTNAVKFTERGSVTLRIDEASATAGAGASAPARRRLRFEVRDTGIGIDEAARARIFEPFNQADSSTTRRYGGSGLGLSISSRLVALMGGRLDVQSVPGEGSVFSFELMLPTVAEAEHGLQGGMLELPAFDMLPERPAPARPAVRPEALRLEAATASTVSPDASAAEPPAPGRWRVLLAEDNPVNQAVAVAMLERLGCSVDCAADGLEALHLAEQGGHAIVFMDCQMPRVDGFEATRRMRQAGLALPVVALTANAMAGDRERCLEAGMDDHLAKPIDLARLAHMLERWCGMPPAPGPLA